MSDTDIKTRDTPGGGMEVQDADGVWITVPHVLVAFVRHHKPAEGFTSWEWHIGQVFSVGLFPPNGIRMDATPEEDAADETIVRAFKDGFERRFPEQVNKFADYMGWKRRVQPTEQKT